MTAYRHNIVEQIREGKRSWTLEDVHGADPGSFNAFIVAPLRGLYADGLVSSLDEHTRMDGDRRYLDRIDITVGVNFPNGGVAAEQLSDHP